MFRRDYVGLFNTFLFFVACKLADTNLGRFRVVPVLRITNSHFPILDSM